MSNPRKGHHDTGIGCPPALAIVFQQVSGYGIESFLAHQPDDQGKHRRALQIVEIPAQKRRHVRRRFRDVSIPGGDHQIHQPMFDIGASQRTLGRFLKNGFDFLVEYRTIQYARFVEIVANQRRTLTLAALRYIFP